MALKRMDNILIVVDDLEAVKAFFVELGLRRIMFAVDDIHNLVASLLATGAELVGELVPYGDAYRLAYIRSPKGIIVGLAEELK